MLVGRYTATVAAAAAGSAVLISSCESKKKVPVMYGSAAEAAAAAAATAAAREQAELEAFHREIERRRPEAETLRKKWDWHEKTSRLPTQAWPDQQPDESELPALKTALEHCNERTKAAREVGEVTAEPWLRECGDFQFALATGFLALSAHPDAQKSGRAMYEQLADMGHADGVCGLGICLYEGRGGPADPARAVELWKRVAEVQDHAESTYQLACAHFHGEGVPEDEVEACRLFRRAAEQDHQAAAYMMGDCLLEGVGVKQDRVEACMYLRQAGMLGHRGARSRYLSLMDDNGQKEIVGQNGQRFTDSSRQTLVA